MDGSEDRITSARGQHVEALSRLLIEFYEKLSTWEHEVVRGKGLTPPQMHTLEILGARGALRMKELAQYMGITTGTLTLAVDRLEGRGLVRRRPNEQDRRSIMVELTEEGRRYFQEHDALHTRLTQDITQGLDDQELENLLVGLQRLLQDF